MWVRPSVTYSALRRRPAPRRRPASVLPCLPRHALPGAHDTFVAHELSDALSLLVRNSSGSGSRPPHECLSQTEHDDSAAAAALWLPFRDLSTTTSTHPAWRTLAGNHALLLRLLRDTPDLLQHLAMPNPAAGRGIAARLRCAQSALALVQHYRADMQRLLALPPPQRAMVDDMRLVQLLATPTRNAAVLVAAQLDRVPGDARSSTALLWTLLSVPSDPAVVHALLTAALRASGSPISADTFQRCVHALLSNDSFFCERTFLAMHQLLVEEVLQALPAHAGDSGVGQGAARRGGFDAVAVRWTPLMNKWARVYTKAQKGFLLHDCLLALLRAAPVAETKMPASFYVRLLGALLDAGAAGGSDGRGGPAEAARSWSAMLEVGADALRLFGRNAAELRAVWVLLLKAALTLHPLRDDHRRLLQAYHVCAQSGHAAPMDRQGFLQAVRLVSAAVCAASTLDEAAGIVRDVCAFFVEQENANFLWLLDGLGTLLTDLWETHGAAARGAAEELLTTVEQTLRARRVVGVDLYGIPAIARALEKFTLGEPPAFWWRCGCGAELPSSSKRCLACLRTASVAWKCPSCAAPHKQSCSLQACSCGQPNPRVAAAASAAMSICGRCGGVKGRDAACERCAEQQDASAAPIPCPHCGTAYQANALHCSTCYATNPRKAALHLWHCGHCGDFNYSIWSSCRTCKLHRKAGVLSFPFVPWACGCGALNHPGRLTCGTCGIGARHHTYTCAGCLAHVSIKSLRCVTLAIEPFTVPVDACPHCHTLHPRSDLLLYASCLPRHCMFCAKTMPTTGETAHDGAFHHCGVAQRVNEHYVFRCPHCDHSDEMQTGYHCRHCLFPRPEVAALLRGAVADGAAPVTAVWRCLHESGEGELCGQWNYGWSARCVRCATGRPDSVHECRAQAQLWQCEACKQENRPIDVLFCPHCQSGLQPVHPCVTCGMPHLSYACRVHMEKSV